MNKNVLYSRVKQATLQNDRTIASKAVEEIQELIFELESALESIMDSGSIGNLREIIDETADMLIMVEQVTGERDAVFLVHDRMKFKLDRLQYRLKNGELFS